MRMTWKVTSLLGTDVCIHASFPLIVMWFVVVARDLGHNSATLAMALALFALASLCILAHEFGHVLAARRFGIGTHEVTLLPIGAVSRMTKNPDSVEQDLVISAAGPAVSVGLALAFAFLAMVSNDHDVFNVTRVAGATIWTKLFWTNVIIAVVNLVPALPMDGGKLIKAGLTLTLGAKRATRIAIVLSYVTGALFCAIGWRLDRFFYVFAALVVVCAYRESQRLRAEEAAKHPRVKDAVVSVFDYLHPEAALADIMDEVLGNPQRDFPVIEGERFAGVVTRTDFARGMKGGAQTVLVREVMRGDYPVVHAEENLVDVLAWMRSEGIWVLPVTNGEHLIGVVRLADAAEIELFHAAQSAALKAS